MTTDHRRFQNHPPKTPFLPSDIDIYVTSISPTAYFAVGLLITSLITRGTQISPWTPRRPRHRSRRHLGTLPPPPCTPRDQRCHPALTIYNVESLLRHVSQGSLFLTRSISYSFITSTQSTLPRIPWHLLWSSLLLHIGSSGLGSDPWMRESMAPRHSLASPQPSSPYILLKCKISYKVDQSLIYDNFWLSSWSQMLSISVSPVLAPLPKSRLYDTREVRPSVLSQRLMADDGRFPYSLEPGTLLRLCWR